VALTESPLLFRPDKDHQCDRAGQPEEVLLRAFLAARVTHKGPVLAMNERTTIANTTGSELLQASDRLNLWRLSQERGCAHTVRLAELQLSNGSRARVSFEDLQWQDDVVGVVARLWLTKERSSGGTATVRWPNQSTLAGWDDLTDTHRAVAELVAAGRTNRQIARAMYLSHHTVDFHLRQIFRRLGISSRVQLARLVIERRDDVVSSASGPVGSHQPGVPVSA
jgi:DNA-binding CsgD family transcriptional regulator